MKKIFYTFFMFCAFILPTYAMMIDGGVTFNVDSARDYVFEGKPYGVEINAPYIFKKDKTVERAIYSYNNNNEIIGITVLYKTEPDKTYIYNRDNCLIYVEKYDKPVNQYPHRGYRYDLQNNLVLTSLTVSKDEMFRFEPNGRLVVHSVNGVIYDENGNVIGHGKNK